MPFSFLAKFAKAGGRVEVAIETDVQHLVTVGLTFNCPLCGSYLGKAVQGGYGRIDGLVAAIVPDVAKCPTCKGAVAP